MSDYCSFCDNQTDSEAHAVECRGKGSAMNLIESILSDTSEASPDTIRAPSSVTMASAMPPMRDAQKVLNAWGDATRDVVGTRDDLAGLCASALASADVVSLAKGADLARRAALDGMGGLMSEDLESVLESCLSMAEKKLESAGTSAGISLWRLTQRSYAACVTLEVKGGLEDCKSVSGGTMLDAAKNLLSMLEELDADELL